MTDDECVYRTLTFMDETVDKVLNAIDEVSADVDPSVMKEQLVITAKDYLVFVRNFVRNIEQTQAFTLAQFIVDRCETIYHDGSDDGDQR